MKRYAIETQITEADAAAHRVLHESNSITTARAFVLGYLAGNDLEKNQQVKIHDTARDVTLYVGAPL
tara:strand:- start:317 stop:517 length:201 start_codon:yes stop_codon:yes gene_type:complete